ncbi:hypothetical protein [Streptomyces sp. NBC_00467]|uniref:hypothetical protein n=1 Tax=Streptomyces sp. NBC_00467 TaxID=2975752 RepID=UPI002E170A00
MRKAQRVAVVAAGAVSVLGLGIGPAHAEGYWSSSMFDWLPGKESRHWKDENRDGVSTYVRFSGCSVSTGTFRYAGLQLKRERVALPDPVVKRLNNACNTVYFGDQVAGTYY